MCMISEVTIDSSAVAAPVPISKVACVSHPLVGETDADDCAVPAVVPMSEDEDGSDSEGYSSMSDDDDLEDVESDSEEVLSSKKSSRQDESLYHELYLPAGPTAAAYTQPITFSGGMDAEECEEYYRTLEEAAEAAAQREAAEQAAAAAHASRKRSPLFRRIGRRDSHKKIKSDDDSSVSSSSFHSAASSVQSTRSSVSFSESVTVHPVFTIDHFDDEIWDNTWTPRRQVKEGKRRAKIEFRFDGCDWRAATEEEGMFRDPRTGLLEHPVHYYDEELDQSSNGRDEVVQMCLIMPGRR